VLIVENIDRLSRQGGKAAKQSQASKDLQKLHPRVADDLRPHIHVKDARMPIGLEARIPVTNRAYDRKVGDYVRMPVTDGLLGQWFIGGNADFSARNRWTKGGFGHGEMYGSPVFSDFYGSFKSGASGIILPLSDAPEMSWLAAVRNTDTMASNATRPMFLGTTPSGSAGSSMWCFNTTQARMSAYYGDSTVAATTPSTILASTRGGC